MRFPLILDCGSCEPFKRGVHQVLMVTAGACCLYSALAWLHRPSTHLAVNFLLYGSLTGVEGYVVTTQHRGPPCTTPKSRS